MPYDLFISYSRRDNMDRPGSLDPAQVPRLNGGDWLHVLATTRLGENELHVTLNLTPP